MTSRGFTAAALTQINAGANEPAHLFEVYLDAGAVYATDSYRPIVWSGNTYAADGQALDFQGLHESSDPQISTVTVTLSGVDQTWLSNVLTHQYLNRRLVIYEFFLDSNGVLVADPNIIFDGSMDAPTIDEDPTSNKCMVSLTAASVESDIMRLPGRHTNETEQQIYFPGDTCFRWMASTNRQITWGGPGTTQAAGPAAPANAANPFAAFGGS